MDGYQERLEFTVSNDCPLPSSKFPHLKFIRSEPQRIRYHRLARWRVMLVTTRKTKDFSDATGLSRGGSRWYRTSLAMNVRLRFV